MLKMENVSIGKSDSLNFYKYLCQQIGSEEVVRIRRLAFTIRDIGYRRTMITSGSKGEGLDLNGSDLDIMLIDQNLKVCQLKTDVKDHSFLGLLIMNTEETQPCFTQLWLLNQCMIINLNMFQKNHLGCNMLSSELYKLFYKNWSDVSDPAYFGGKIHGPCISDQNDLFDLAWCLKCDKWIHQARPWISRPRTTWPSPENISKIVSCGVLFVPIGCKGSINEHLEWRISFSVAEKCLIFSFNHTQLLCYAMLKILLKEVVEKHEDMKGLLCSYFLKTLMFWISEETETYLWRPDNLIPCLMACLQKLLYCVKYSILSHYFIPDNNLFFLRFNITNREKLTTILKNIYEQGIFCFLSSETIQNYQSHSYNITEFLESGNVRFLQQLMSTFSYIRLEIKSDELLKLLSEFLHHARTDSSRALFALQISAACRIVPEATKYKDNSGNKSHYLTYKHDLSLLTIGLHTDSVSGLLKLSSFFYVHKNYFVSFTIITYTLQKFTDEQIDLFELFFHKKTFNHSQKHVLKLMKKEKFYTIIKSLAINPLIFEEDSSIIPQELQPDVGKMQNLFHHLPFAHLLRFLCYYRLHDITFCTQSFQQLTHVQRKLKKFGSENLVTCFSLNTFRMCGICYQLMGETNLAVRAFQEAANFD